MNTRIPALIPAIFTTRSVCLAGSGITSGSSVAAAKWIKKKLFKCVSTRDKEIIFGDNFWICVCLNTVVKIKIQASHV